MFRSIWGYLGASCSSYEVFGEHSEVYLRVPGSIWVYMDLSAYPRGNEAVFRKQLKGNLGVSRGIGLVFGKPDSMSKLVKRIWEYSEYI